MSDLHFVSVRAGDEAPVEFVTATAKGTLRAVPLTEQQALLVIADLARYVRMSMGSDGRYDR